VAFAPLALIPLIFAAPVAEIVPSLSTVKLPLLNVTAFSFVPVILVPVGLLIFTSVSAAC
jgi:hypothetical protein